MAWSTKGAIIGDLHGLQVNRHYPHHSPFICSFWEQDLSILQDFLRIYGFEGAAPKEGEDVTRTSESSSRREALRLCNSDALAVPRAIPARWKIHRTCPRDQIRLASMYYVYD